MKSANYTISRPAHGRDPTIGNQVSNDRFTDIPEYRVNSCGRIANGQLFFISF